MLCCYCVQNTHLTAIFLSAWSGSRTNPARWKAVGTNGRSTAAVLLRLLQNRVSLKWLLKTFSPHSWNLSLCFFVFYGSEILIVIPCVVQKHGDVIGGRTTGCLKCFCTITAAAVAAAGTKFYLTPSITLVSLVPLMSAQCFSWAPWDRANYWWAAGCARCQASRLHCYPAGILQLSAFYYRCQLSLGS